MVAHVGVSGEHVDGAVVVAVEVVGVDPLVACVAFHHGYEGHSFVVFFGAWSVVGGEGEESCYGEEVECLCAGVGHGALPVDDVHEF